MKRNIFLNTSFLSSILFLSAMNTPTALAAGFHQYTESKARPISLPEVAVAEETEVCDKCGLRHHPYVSERTVQEILAELPVDTVIADYYRLNPPMTREPLVYSGFRTVTIPSFTPPAPVFSMDPRLYAYDRDRYAGILYDEGDKTEELEEGDEVLRITTDAINEQAPEETAADINEGPLSPIPDWLITGLKAQRIYQDMQYMFMVNNPDKIQYAAWDLPTPPRLPQDDHSFKAFLERLDLPEVDTEAAIIPEFEQKRINWLHTVGAGLQFSQAYISRNWYQGGNNYLALLFNFNWDVVLNTNFHPNKMFTSNLSYKLALNSNPRESLHSYSISQDLLQYNLKLGLKAFRKWFYSFTLQFKTQIFNSYPADSEALTASFLSPGDFNVGLGMTYNLSAKNNTLKFAASISPISYNLKTCLSKRIDHLQYNIAADRYTHSEIGSSAELTLSWDITSNINWKSRLFLFSDYSYFLADWENTLVFNINKFLSTQIYIHPRFDSSSDRLATSWRYWSLKEILSFGLSYTFSTKP